MPVRLERFGALALIAVLGLGRAALLGLSDPSEARYAQISWEMAEGGDWLVPRWNGIPHLEKPPLAYWAGAAGIRLFGRSEFGVRFFPVLALLLSAWLTARMARRLIGPEAEAPALASFVLPYVLAVGAALLTDTFVMLGAVLFHHAVLRRLLEGSRRALDWAAVGLALGVLAKGHTVLLFTLVPCLLARTGVLREVFAPRRIALLLLLTLPWFAAVLFRFPDFLSLHSEKLADFVTTGKQHHKGPVWIYAAALLAGLYPFTLWVRSGVRRFGGAPARLLGLWLLVPLLFLSAIPSRSWTYILPSAPALALIGTRGLAHGALHRHWWSQGTAALAAGAAGFLFTAFAAGRVLPHELVASACVLSGMGVSVGLLFLLLARARPRFSAVAAAAAMAAGSSLAVHVEEPAFRIHRELARKVDSLAGRDGPVTVVGVKVPSLPFYLGRLVTVVAVRDRLAQEGRRWGGTPHFRPDVDAVRFLREDSASVIVVEEDLRARIAPDRVPVYRCGDLCVLVGKPPPAKDS
jgi:4-amino-4-deoxy-L-arabinose transferase-like glycosyltransferase